MEKEDYCIRVTAKDGAIRGFFSTTKNIANESFNIHKTSPVMTAAMGRLLTVTSMMGLMQKGDKDVLTNTIKGNGPAKSLLATATSNGYVKGYPQVPIVDIPLKSNGKLDVAGAIMFDEDYKGFGTLNIVKDMGLKEPYSGQIELVSGEIADDFTYYFSKSEQTPTSVALGVLVDTDYSVKSAGGFIIQLMPFCEDETIDILEENLRNLPQISKMLSEGLTPEDIANKVLGNLDLEVHEKNDIKYHCNCERERVEKALISIGKAELLDILETDKKATLHCHFCNTNYLFNEDDIKNILEKC